MDFDRIAARLAREWCQEHPHHPICHHNLGIHRTQMPQIRSGEKKAFLEWLQAQGIGVKHTRIPAGRLKATQRNLIPRYIDRVLDEGAVAVSRNKPMIASSDGYILDGHHRWGALQIEDPDFAVPVIQVGVPIRKLLRLVMEFPGVQFSNVLARHTS